MTQERRPIAVTAGSSPGKEVVDARRREVETMLLAPLSYRQIIETITHEWKVSRKTAQNDITIVRRSLIREFEETKDSMRAEAIARVHRKLVKTENANEWTPNLGFEKLLGQIVGYIGEENKTVNNTLSLTQIVLLAEQAAEDKKKIPPITPTTVDAITLKPSATYSVDNHADSTKASIVTSAATKKNHAKP